MARSARRADDHPPSFVGWRTSDEEEIARRRWRARSEVPTVEAVDAADPFFGTYRVRSTSGTGYEVEIRTLVERENSCGCLDHAVNGLGTCKHIEATLHALRRGRARLFDRAAQTGCPWPEIYVARGDAAGPRVRWPANPGLTNRLRGHLGAWVSGDGALVGEPLESVPALRQALAALPATLGRRVRVSRHLETWLVDRARRRDLVAERQRFQGEVERGAASLEVLRHPLLPYQREGTLHLAFGRRALLADEMGLGKTVQAIAACELLRRRHGIERVLVVAPASLKGEWQEQIARFIGLPARIVEGDRAARRQLYRQPAFFSLANYEQVIPDGVEINRLLRPDVIILDEAQRIKNWQTKTARAVKSLVSPYAFVLTGTPLENRIDEVYSIVQYLDPGLLGPLFRFNRAFHDLDERGRPVGYRNLDKLHERLKPVMLRRRKSEVEGQLPRRSVRTHLVAMHPEQRLRYEDYELRVTRLVALARRRALTREEFERLQKLLACMRMLCDTPYILDSECRVCPKLDELETLFGDLLSEQDCKIIVFSEWVRMLELVGGLAREMDLEVAWHTGAVPQQRRRAEIRRFKEDPLCRLFLSSDSGSVGLNLQAANVVINLDLPWNPAKLEQRVARAWRKHQTRPVRVFNLVTEGSIEQRMQDVLSGKQDLADGVLDGRGDLKTLRMPSGRAAFMERLEAAMGGVSEGPVLLRREFSAERLRADLLARHGERLLLLETWPAMGAGQTVLAVLDAAPAEVEQEAERLRLDHCGVDDSETMRFELLDRASYSALKRLIDAGIVDFAGDPSLRLHEAPAPATAVPPIAAE